MQNQTVVAHTRLNVSTYNLLNQIARATKLSRSHLLRAALSQWLKNAPSDLPLELKIAITRELIKEQVETIKALRWIYYMSEEARLKIKFLDKHKAEKKYFPRHVRKTLKQLERNIISQQKQLNTWLKTTQTSMRCNLSNEQNVYTDTERH